MKPARRWLGYLGILVLGYFTLGCQSYRERFTYFAPDGSTNHVVDVSYHSCLLLGKAARLRTETQTGEFIRNVNADGIEFKPDAESVKAITEGVSEAVLKSLKPVP